MKTILNYFLRGLLLVFPLFATLYILSVLINWIDNRLYGILFGWLPFDIPGAGIVTAFILIALLGYLITKAFTKPIINYFERLFVRIPLFKIIYTAFKDLTEAFVGDKKKFNQPCIVKLIDGVDRLGFITSENLETLGIQNRLAVYCPHSYNFSGNLFLVGPERVRPLDIDPTDVMKFVVSAGVTKMEGNAHKDKSAVLE